MEEVPKASGDSAEAEHLEQGFGPDMNVGDDQELDSKKSSGLKVEAFRLRRWTPAK